MISYIAGTVVAVSPKRLIIETNGVGYSVVLPTKIHTTLAKIGTTVKLFVYSHFSDREGVFNHYAFIKPEELAFFELLLTVSGVGPKSAQEILSEVDLATLQLAILKGDAEYLRKVAGTGPKTSQRIILELKNKMLTTDLGVSQDRDFASEGEAIDALVALGYSAYQAKEVLKDVSNDAKTSEDKIRAALQILAKQKRWASLFCKLRNGRSFSVC